MGLALSSGMSISIEGGVKMKRKAVLAIIAAIVLTTAYAPLTYAGPHHGHYGRGGYYAAGALVGGLLLGTVLGSAISQPRYVVSQPAYAYPAPSAAYAPEEPPGEWILVPGRWVNGRWIPAHRVWAPVNPY